MNAAFQALSDPTRREILKMLRQRAMTAGELADKFQLAKSTMSGLIVAERQGASFTYSLNLSVVEQTIAAVLDLFEVGKPERKKLR